MFAALAASLVLPLVAAAAYGEDAAPSLNPLHDLRKDTLRAFRERPLFNPARAEPQAVTREAAMPAAEAPSEEPPDLRLVGIVSGPANFAMVRLHGDTGPITTLTTGDKIGAWTATVLPDALRLDAGTRSVAIDLFAPKSAQDGPSADAPAGGGEPPSAPDDHTP
jgi:hypothetical protein